MKKLSAAILFMTILSGLLWAENGNAGNQAPSSNILGESGMFQKFILGTPLLPEESARIRENPSEFLELLEQILKAEPILTRLVNKENKLSRDYVPQDLLSLDNYKNELCLSRKGHRFRAAALPALKTMSRDAEKEGIQLMISSAYRSWEYQKKLFERYTAQDGLAAAERYSARPGASQHQLGTVIDFGSIDDSFAETRAGKWLKENAWKYGFSMSYPKGMEELTGYVWESWHYRYIGIAAAKMEKEYFGGLQERMLRCLNASK